MFVIGVLELSEISWRFRELYRKFAKWNCGTMRNATWTRHNRTESTGNTFGMQNSSEIPSNRLSQNSPDFRSLFEDCCKIGAVYMCVVMVRRSRRIQAGIRYLRAHLGSRDWSLWMAEKDVIPEIPADDKAKETVDENSNAIPLRCLEAFWLHVGSKTAKKSCPQSTRVQSTQTNVDW